MIRAGTLIVAAVFTLGAGAASAQTCVKFETSCGETETVAGESIASSNQAVSTAIGNEIDARFGSVTKDVASQGGGGAASANTAYWVSAAGKTFNGTTEGFQNEAVAGVDVYFGDSSLAGAYFGLGKSSRKALAYGSPTEIVARVIGLYYAHQYADTTILHFYAGGGQADYRVDGTPVDGDRYMAGIDVSKSVEGLDAATFVPFGKVLVASDKLPAFVDGGLVSHNAATILGATVTAGGRLEYKDPILGTALLPYVSLGLDYIYVDSDSPAGISRTWGPRLEAGVSGPVGTGLLSVDLHAAKADTDTRDVGGALTYSFGF